MDCPKCGTHNPEDADHCRLCGNAFPKDSGPSGPARACPFCGTKNDLEVPFCLGCNRLISPMRSRLPKHERRREKKEKYYDRTYADYPSSSLRNARL